MCRKRQNHVSETSGHVPETSESCVENLRSFVGNVRIMSGKPQEAGGSENRDQMDVPEYRKSVAAENPDDVHSHNV